MSTIFWDDRPPSDPGQRLPIPVWSLPPGNKAFVRFLGPWRGLWMHWSGCRTTPCTGEACSLCAADVRQRWTGYAPALVWELDPSNPKASRWKTIICPITEAMADLLRPEKITGLVVELNRPGKRPNGPILCTPVDRPVKDALPPAFDVTPILLRMWGLRSAAKRRPMDETPAGDAEESPNILPFRRQAAGDESAAELG